MRSHRRARVRSRWPLVLLGLAALAVAGYAAFRLLTRESAAPASLASAVERFEALPAAARELPPALRGRAPTPGVYVYATRGFEVSHVLGTRRHAYPARTTISVSTTPSGCLRERWDVLATRWDALRACPRADGGWRLVSLSEQHRFAGHLDERTYACTPGSTHLPPALTAGTSWSSRCAIDGTTTTDVTTVLGPRALALADGRRARTVLLRTSTRVRGETSGVGTTFTWILPRSGLVVRRTIANANSTDTLVGAVRYDERATLVLSSPRPRR